MSISLRRRTEIEAFAEEAADSIVENSDKEYGLKNEEEVNYFIEILRKIL